MSDALYIGKPFGTVWGYISIITWGVVTPTALTAVAAALNNLGALTALGQRLRVWANPTSSVTGAKVSNSTGLLRHPEPV